MNAWVLLFHVQCEAEAMLRINKFAKFLLIATTIGLVLFMFELSRIGIADFMRLEPGAYLDAVRASNARPLPAKLAAAREHLLVARTLDPGNPIIPEYLGQISFYRATLSEFDAQLQQEYFKDALENYEAAIAIRPNSGYLWASVMITRQALLDISRRVPDVQKNTMLADNHSFSEVVDAMRHAAQLAPWEPGVIEQIIRVGTIHYPELSVQDQAVLDSASVRAQKLGLNTKI